MKVSKLIQPLEKSLKLSTYKWIYENVFPHGSSYQILYMTDTKGNDLNVAARILYIETAHVIFDI